MRTTDSIDNVRWTDIWDRDKEIDRLRQRVAELEGENKALKADNDELNDEIATMGDANDSLLYEEVLRQRVEELKRQRELGFQYFEELQKRYKQRGERMKEINKALRMWTVRRTAFEGWFDPETGEPL